MHSIPMIANKARDEEFGADAVGFGEVERVVNQKGVTNGLVDHAVKNVG